MNSTHSRALAALFTTLAGLAIAPVAAQTGSHANYVRSIRSAVKHPESYHELYNLVIRPEFNQTVREAAKAGDDGLVMELLEAYSGQSSDPARGGTVLTWAAYYSDAPLLKILLDRRLDVNAADANGDTPLHRALGIGRTDIVALLLRHGAEVNRANRDGDTPLMLAAGDKQTLNTRAILYRRADVNARNRQGQTPLMFAANNGRLENVRLLLAKGANAKLRDAEGNTALTLAIQSAGAPYASFHDSPGLLDQSTADRLAAQAKRDQAAIILALQRAGGN